MAPRTNNDHLLMDLSQALGLEYEQQDWGIVNADGSRLLEFIVYYDEHPALSSTQRFELGGLILASANEVLLKSPNSLLGEFSQFLALHAEDFLAEVEYWESLENPDEFPISAWLQRNYMNKGK